LNLEYKRLLFIGAHPDDVELGCGGLIAKNNRRNKSYYMVLSPCKDASKKQHILAETRKATGTLGLSEQSLFLHDLPRRVLFEQRDKVRNALIAMKQTVKPDLVFCPSLHDIHQDHMVVAEESFRLFRDVSVLAYENPRSSLNFIPNLYVPLSKEHLQKKVDALMCYESQFDRYYFTPQVIESFASMRGAQCQMPFAEAYEVLRLHG